MSFTLCTSGAIKLKAGANASTTITDSNSNLASFCDEAEAFIMSATRYDWVANYSSVSTNAKQFLSEVCSSHAGMQVVSYDISKYKSKAEAQTILNVLSDKVQRGIELLKLDQIKTGMGITTP
jgi:hypothetical protein